MISSRQFILEQGYTDSDVNDGLYQALMFQPRAVGLLFSAGVVIQSAWFFATLGVMLWLGALAPAYNPFDRAYNAVLARRGRLRLAGAPAPRRFAAGMAGTVALTVAVTLSMGRLFTSWGLETLFMAGVLAVVVRRVCGGARLYWLLARAFGVAASSNLPSDREPHQEMEHAQAPDDSTEARTGQDPRQVHAEHAGRSAPCGV